jgi:hypothetical protein
MRSRVIFHNNGKRTYEIDGQEVSKAEFDSAGNHINHSAPLGVPMLAGNTSSCWPMKSDAMAVHPKDIQKAMERNRKHGVYVEYDPEDGRAILPDQGAKRELMKIEKVHDKNGGYGTDHHISERAPEVDPATVAACKFVDSIPVKGFK